LFKPGAVVVLAVLQLEIQVEAVVEPVVLMCLPFCQLPLAQIIP
jgi:hypothetical protein